MQSLQIQTAPLIRNFATRIDDACIQVTTKLGTQTLVRAEFERSTFPTESEQQMSFLKELIGRTSPGAIDLLQDVAARCIEDQCAAVRKLISHGSGTSLNS